jgi:GTP-binding protein TypA/BipA
MQIKKLRNIAIIAHVDHGKTTLVDAMLKQSGVFRSNEQVAERVMDSNDLERERGITILAKNTAVMWNDMKINIVDTPGHADFGGEVERTLGMVDGVLLLVDAYEGPMPQTKYVLRKALEKGLKPIVVVNKVDRPDQRAIEVVDEVLDLFIELDADDEQLEFPVLFASARSGFAKVKFSDEDKDLQPLFEAIIEYIPEPPGDSDQPLQMMVSALDRDEYVGRIAIGRISRGKISYGQQVVVTNGDEVIKTKVGTLYGYEGLKRTQVESAEAGDIIAIAGLSNFHIGYTVTDTEVIEALPVLRVDEPTLSVFFAVNTSPFAGREGQFVTSRHLRERLFRETETNVSLKVVETDSPDSFEVFGRGELHISVLIETMRREGYEFQVGKPKVIFKRINDEVCEPMEFLTIDVSQEYMGAVMERLGTRKAELVNMTELAGYMRLEFIIPARGLIGFRSEFLTSTRGNGVMNHLFHGYAPYKGEIPGRVRGSLVAFEAGETTPYGLYGLQDRGVLFIGPTIAVYEGMIIGENTRDNDMDVNPCKKKQITNMRASGSDEALRLEPPKRLSLEQSLEFIANDEWVEITPESIRMRKGILDKHERAKAKKQKEAAQ